jgi:hypothetical protein
MSLLPKWLTARKNPEAPAEEAPTKPAYAIPTIKFDKSLVTETVKADLRENIAEVKDFEKKHLDAIYEASLRAVNAGGALNILYDAILKLNITSMTKRRASEISIFLSHRTTALITKERQQALGVKEARWSYAGAPCQADTRNPSAKDIAQDEAHKAANGKHYAIGKGMYLNGTWTLPGREEGCRCVSRAIIPGFNG